MTPNEYCRSKAAPAGSTLHYGTLYLDAPRADALIALHALRAELDDIVRHCHDIEPAREKLAWWRAEIGECVARRASHPVSQALAAALTQFPIDESRLFELVAGFEADLHQGRYADFAALEHHCLHVSATLHEAANEILGGADDAARQFARDAGVVLQLGDVLRNVGRDARSGRIYVPEAEMRQFNVTEDDIFAARHGDATRALFAFQLQRIRALRDKALARLGAHRKVQRATLALLAIQTATLDEIERDDFRLLDRRVSLTPVRKLWIATRIWLRP